MRCAVSERMGLGVDADPSAWLDSISKSGVEFVVVPDSAARRNLMLDHLDAVLLADVPGPAARFGEGPDLRDHRTERELVRHARARRLPLVGVGHGAEFLGRYFGGGLRPQPEEGAKDGCLELMRLVEGTPRHERLPSAGQMLCDNEEFPEMLIPFAWGEQGQIAGFVHRDEPILGIHWQPAAADDGTVRLILDALRDQDWPGASRPRSPLKIEASESRT